MRNWKKLACAVCAGMLAVPAFGAAAEAETVSLSAQTDRAHAVMTEAADGSFRLVLGDENGVNVLRYKPQDGQITAAAALGGMLPMYGGTFCGEKYSFVLSGAMNTEESEKTEVLRLQVYNKDWTLRETLSLYGENTMTPFKSGTVSFAEYDGILHIHSSHQMFKTSDGYNHQASMRLAIDEETLDVVNSITGLSSWRVSSYVSHSFWQATAADADGAYFVDIGDTLPRALTLATAAPETFAHGRLNLYTISGNAGDNSTGVELGNVITTADRILVGSSSIDQTAASFDPNGQKNAVLSVVPKDLSEAQNIQLTSYAAGAGVTVTAPRLVASEDGILAVWNETDSKGTSLHVQPIGLDGTVAKGGAKVYELPAVSGTPILCSDGKARWFSAEDAGDQMKITVCAADLAKGTVTTEAAQTVDKDLAVTEDAGDQPAEQLPGDLNGDGKLTTADAVLLFRVVSEDKTAGMPLDAASPDAADLNQDGNLDITDVCALRAKLLGA